MNDRNESVKKVVSDIKIVKYIVSFYVILTNIILLFNLFGFASTVVHWLVIAIVLFQIVWIAFADSMRNKSVLSLIVNFINSSNVFIPKAIVVDKERKVKSLDLKMFLKDILSNESKVGYHMEENSFWEPLILNWKPLKKRALFLTIVGTLFLIIVTTMFILIPVFRTTSLTIVIGSIVMRHILIYIFAFVYDLYKIIGNIQKKNETVLYFYSLKHLYNAKSSFVIDEDKKGLYEVVNYLQDNLHCNNSKLTNFLTVS